MRLRLYLSVPAAPADAPPDLHLFIAVRKLRRGRHMGFEGSYGFGHDAVTRGWLNVTHRLADAERSTPWLPVSRHDIAEPLPPAKSCPWTWSSCHPPRSSEPAT